jgi:uncharacterized membrane protein YkgB
MRPEERYWLTVSLTIGVVALMLLLLIILGLTNQLGHLYDSIVRLAS